MALCGQKLVLRVTVCPMSAVPSGHGIILVLSANMGVRSASSPAFGLQSQGDIVMCPFLLPDRLDGSDFLETVLPRLIEDVRLAVGQKSWFQYDGASTNYGEDSRLVG